MSDNNLRPIWTPADYEETLAEAAKHRAIPGAYEAQAALYAEASEHAGRHRKPHVITADVEFGTKAHEMLLAGRAPALPEGTVVLWKPHFDEAAVEGTIAGVIEFDPEFPTMGRLYVLGWTDHRGRLGRTKVTEDRVLAVVEDQDDDRPLPFRRNPNAECPSCWAFPGEVCGPFCLSRMTPAEQVAHRDHVIEGTLAELDRIEAMPSPAEAMSADVPPWADGRHDRDDDPFAVTSCTIAGRHRVRPDPWRRVRRLRAVIGVAVVVLVLALGALWAASHAKAETFDVCPSGLSGVATPDTSCAFADSVRAAFYWQPSWTVIATSPVTGKFYTMQCSRTWTDVYSWPDPKRCFGVNDAGAVLVVYVR